MSGGCEDNGKIMPSEVEEVMKLFSVDEKTARRIISYSTNYAIEKMDRWKRNYLKRHRTTKHSL